MTLLITTGAGTGGESAGGINEPGGDAEFIGVLAGAVVGGAPGTTGTAGGIVAVPPTGAAGTTDGGGVISWMGAMGRTGATGFCPQAASVIPTRVAMDRVHVRIRLRLAILLPSVDGQRVRLLPNRDTGDIAGITEEN